jgi:hypothetical protein
MKQNTNSIQERPIPMSKSKNKPIIYNDPNGGTYRGHVISYRRKKLYVEFEGQPRARWVRAEHCVPAVADLGQCAKRIEINLTLTNVPLDLKALMAIAERQAPGEKLPLMITVLRLVKEHCICIQDFDLADELRTAQKQLERHLAFRQPKPMPVVPSSPTIQRCRVCGCTDCEGLE